jgi:hypothetical protein
MVKTKTKPTVIKGYIPVGIRRKQGMSYFSVSRQKWVSDMGKLKISDILSTPTVPLAHPKKTLKNLTKKELDVIKIEITIYL